SLPFLVARGGIQRVDLGIQTARVDGPAADDRGRPEPVAAGELPFLLAGARVDGVELTIEGADVKGASRDPRRGDDGATDEQAPPLGAAVAVVALPVDAPVGRSHVYGITIHGRRRPEPGPAALAAVEAPLC